MKIVKLAIAVIVAAAAAGCEQPSAIVLPSQETALAGAPTQWGNAVFSTTSTCEPGGWYYDLGGAWYNHIANGFFTEDACWNPGIRTEWTSSTTCGYTWPANGYRFGYPGRFSSPSIAQSVVIPDTMDFFHSTNFDLTYNLDFIDPNNDGGNNSFTATVVDMTTGATLAQEYYNGSLPDLACASRTLSFSGNLAGHTLRVIFAGSTGYPDTTIRVLHAALWQYP